jgi:hypothetical protein
MSGAARHYDGDEVLLVAFGVPVSEFAKGTFVSLEFDEDDWTVTQGHQGTVLRAKNPNSVATCTFQTVQGSPENDQLSAAATLDVSTGFGTGSFYLQDLNGNTASSGSTSWCKKRPKIGLGTEGDVVEWTATVAGIQEWHVGQNRLA